MNSNVKAAMEAIARYEQERGNGNQDSAHVKATHLNCALIALDHLDLLHANVPKEAASGMTTCDLNGWLESIGVGDSAVIYDYIVAKHWVTTRITARKFVKAHPDGDYLIVTKGMSLQSRTDSLSTQASGPSINMCGWRGKSSSTRNRNPTPSGNGRRAEQSSRESLRTQFEGCCRRPKLHHYFRDCTRCK